MTNLRTWIVRLASVCALLLAALGVFPAQVFAAEAYNVPYYDTSGDFQWCGSATWVTENDTIWGASDGAEHWYLAEKTVTIDHRVTVAGNVHLILVDGCTLTVNGGIDVAAGNSFTIYGQEKSTGALTATGGSREAGIGGSGTVSGGSVTIAGGVVAAHGGDSGGAGIGGGGNDSYGSYAGSGGTLLVTGGKVTATGGSDGAGIGGGGNTWNAGGSGGTVTITGGTVVATGVNRAAGIGGGLSGSGGTVTISGGSVTATGGTGGGAGIGGGYGGRYFGSGGTVTISGGSVTATGGRNGAGIGRGDSGAGGGSTTITGGFVTATGSGFSTGAGISGSFSTSANGTAGTAIVFASSIEDSGSQSNWSGLIFAGVFGQVYGASLTLFTDLEIPEGYALTIPQNSTLTVPSGVTLTNNGAIISEGTITNEGTIVNTNGIIYSDKDIAGVTGELPLSQANDVAYVDADGEEQKRDGVGRVLPSSLTLGKDGVSTWYVVEYGVTVPDRIKVAGDVHLILADGCVFSAQDGIFVPENASLTVYGQSNGTGHLNAIASSLDGAGIGGDKNNGANAGTITINGGVVDAQGRGVGVASIGSGHRGGSGAITVNGGEVHAKIMGLDSRAGVNGCGIGATGVSCEIVLNGGTIYANTLASAHGNGIAGHLTTGENGNAVLYVWHGNYGGGDITDSSDQANWDITIWTSKTLIGSYSAGYATMYGEVALDGSLVLASGQTLTVAENAVCTIADGGSLAIGEGSTLTNNSKIVVQTGGSFTNAGVASGGTLTDAGGTIVRGSQAAPSESPEVSIASSNSLELTSFVSGGYGGVQYALVEGDNATADDAQWISDGVFEGLGSAEPYTAFVRFEGDQYYAPSVASPGRTVYTAAATPSSDEGFTIDYVAETATAKQGYEIRTDNVQWNTGTIGVMPGHQLWMRVAADPNGAPASSSCENKLPNRPALSIADASVARSGDAFTVSAVEKDEGSSALEYSLDGNSWQDGGAFTSLDDVSSVYVRRTATASAFASAAQQLHFGSIEFAEEPFTYQGAPLTARQLVKSATYGGTAADLNVDLSLSYASADGGEQAAGTPTNTGSYQLTATLDRKDLGSGGVYWPYSETVQVTVEPQSLDAAWFVVAGDGLTYTGTALMPAVSVTEDAPDYLSDATGDDWSVSYEDNLNAGTAQVVVTGAGNFKGTVSLPFEIARAAVTVEVDAPDVTYSGDPVADPQVTATDANGNESDGEVTIAWYASDDNGGWNELDEAPSAVGSYCVVARVAEGANHLAGEDSVEFEIVKQAGKVITLSAPEGKTYDGTAVAAPTVEDLGGYDGGADAVTFTWRDAAGNELDGAPTATGTYTVTASAPATATQEAPTFSPAASQTVVIAAKPLTIGVADAEVPYGSEAPGVEDVTLTGMDWVAADADAGKTQELEDALRVGLSLSWTSDAGAYKPDAAAGSTFAAELEWMGSDNAALANYTIAFDDKGLGTLTVVASNASTMTVVAHDAAGDVQDRFTYGDTITVEATVQPAADGATLFTAAQPDVAAARLTCGDTVLASQADRVMVNVDGSYTLRFTYSTTGKGISTAGAQALTVAFAGDGNLPAASASVQVTLRPLEVTASLPDGISKVYDGTAAFRGVDLVLDGVLDDDDFSAVATASTSQADVGADLALNVLSVETSGADEAFYALADKVAPGTATITPAPLHDAWFTVAGEGLTYMGQAQTPAVSVTEDAPDYLPSAAGDAWSASYEGNVDAGTAYAVVTGTGNFVGTVRVPFQIARAAVTVNVTMPNAVYTGGPVAEPKVTAADGLGNVSDGAVTLAWYVADDNGGWTPLAGAPTVVGSYRVVANVAEGTNHLAGEGSAEFQILKQDGALIALGTVNSKTYDGAALANPEVIDLDGYDGSADAVTFTWHDAEGNELEATPVNAGTYTVTASAPATDTQEAPNFNLPTQTVTIYRASQTLATDQIAVTGETVAGACDGAITVSGLAEGVAWEWRAAGGSWSVGEDDAVAGLTPGAYEVRLAGSENYEPSAVVPVTVASFSDAHGGIGFPSGSTDNGDGTVTLPDGGGTVTLPDGGQVDLPGGSVVDPDGGAATLSGDGGVVSVPGGPEVSLPGGSTVDLGSGLATTPDGITVRPGDDGSLVIIFPDGAKVTVPSGSVVGEDGVVSMPDGSTVKPGGSGTVIVVLPDGSEVQAPSGSTVRGDGTVVGPDGALVQPVDADGNGLAPTGDHAAFAAGIIVVFAAAALSFGGVLRRRARS